MKDILRTGDPVSFLGAECSVLSVRIKDDVQTVCIICNDGFGHSSSTITDVNHVSFSPLGVSPDWLERKGFEQVDTFSWEKRQTEGKVLIEFSEDLSESYFRAYKNDQAEPLVNWIKLRGAHHLLHLIEDVFSD